MSARAGIAGTISNENEKEKRKKTTAKRNCNLEIGNWKSQIAPLGSALSAFDLY